MFVHHVLGHGQGLPAGRQPQAEPDLSSSEKTPLNKANGTSFRGRARSPISDLTGTEHGGSDPRKTEDKAPAMMGPSPTRVFGHHSQIYQGLSTTDPYPIELNTWPW